MSARDVDLGGVEITESVLISSSREIADEANSNDVLAAFMEPEVAKKQVGSEVEPAMIKDVPAKGEESPTESDKPKVLMTLEVANVGGSANANGNAESKEADSAQSEVLLGMTPSPGRVETVRISNADSSNEITQKAFLHNNRPNKAQDSIEEDESFEVVEVIGMPCVSKQLSTCSETNPLADVTNDELIAILEGDVDSTTAKAESSDEGNAPTFVVEVIEDENQREKTPQADEMKQIALEQLRNMSSRKRGRAPQPKQDGGTLVSSLVSDWSDNEKEPEPSPKATTTTKVSKASSAPATNKVSKAPPQAAPATNKVPKAPPQAAPPTQRATPAPAIAATTVQKASNPPAKPAAKPIEKKMVMVKKAPISKQPPKAVIPTVTSMKPSRIIKKKIIWDPDAPETQFSYASLVKTPATPRSRKSSSASSTGSVQKRKPELTPKTPRQEPEIRRKSEPLATAKPKPSPAQEAPPKPRPIPPVTSAAMQPKVRILNKIKRTSPTTVTAVQNKKKRVSEIDRLLNDEGAANMLSTLDSEKPVPKDARARKVPTPVPAQTEAAQRKPVTPKKRTGRSPASGGWDYVYNDRNADSLIIRRRSNSSYSSTTSPRRLSIEGKPVRLAKAKAKSFEFAKPEVKRSGKLSLDSGSKTIIEDIKKSSPQETSRKSARTSSPVESKQARTADASITREEKTAANVTVKKHGNVVQLILKPKQEKVHNSFSAQLMNDVVRHLDVLESDNACKVVLITSSAPNFCQGVDFLALTQGNADKRKSAVQELAGSVTSFLKALLTFPKPLIAGVGGICSGIGITMLPAFDVVICSDKSVFDAPYSKIGQIPEGHCLLTSTNNVRHSFKVKLLWLCEKLTSTEAALSGIVTTLTAPSKVVDDALQCAKHIATLSQQSLLAIKAQKPDTKKLLLALNEEQKILVNQWQSPECQEKFKQFIANETW